MTSQVRCGPYKKWENHPSVALKQLSLHTLDVVVASIKKTMVASFLDDDSLLLDRLVKLSNNMKNGGLAGMLCYVWSCVATGLIQQVVLDFWGPVGHGRLSFTEWDLNIWYANMSLRTGF